MQDYGYDYVDPNALPASPPNYQPPMRPEDYYQQDRRPRQPMPASRDGRDRRYSLLTSEAS